MDQHSSEYNEPWPAYSTNFEVFIALRDVDYTYPCLKQKSLPYSKRGLPVRVGIKNLARRVIGFYKPPGAPYTWIQKAATEIIHKEKSPKFASKLIFQCEECDAAGILLKFDVHDPRNSEVDIIGSVEVALDVLLAAGAAGLELPIYSILEPFDPASGTTRLKQRQGLEPGKIFLRAELLRPIDYAVLIKFGLRMNTGRCFRKMPLAPYFYEFYKLNDQTMFEIPHPYTLIHRSESIKYTGTTDEESWNYIVLPVNQMCNGELARVLKMEIYQDGEVPIPKGFSLTTLRKMLVDRELVFPITKQQDGKISTSICLHASLCYEIPLNPFKYYMNKGCSIRRIYAVDYSGSNWNLSLHRRCLHDTEAGRTPYEEALVMSGGSLIDIAQGDSIFYSFGSSPSGQSNLMRPYVANFSQENHIRSLLGNYREALYGAKMNMDTLHGSSTSCFSAPPAPPHRLSRAGSTVSVRGGSALGNAKGHLGMGSPGVLNSIGHGTPHKAQLCPLLANIIEYLSGRVESFEYHVLFVLTDGEIGDLEQSKNVILNLAKLPVSLIFIGIGLGKLSSLLELEREWYHPQTGDIPPRKVVHLIHFRSLMDWDSAIKQSHFVTDPPEIFRREIGTILQESLPNFMRIYRTAI